MMLALEKYCYTIMSISFRKKKQKKNIRHADSKT